MLQCFVEKCHLTQLASDVQKKPMSEVLLQGNARWFLLNYTLRRKNKLTRTGSLAYSKIRIQHNTLYNISS